MKSRKQTGKAGKKRKAPDDEEKVGLLLRLNVEGHTALKVMAAKERRTLSSLAVEALNDLLKKRGEKARIVDCQSKTCCDAGICPYFSAIGRIHLITRIKDPRFRTVPR